MKRIISVTIAMLCIVILNSCKKDPNAVTSNTLDVPKTTGIKLGEPLIFKMNAVGQADSVKWSVSPSSNITIRANGNQASIIFNTAGTYHVQAATVNQLSTKTVTIDSAVYHPTPAPSSDMQSLAGDKLTITPYVHGVPDSLQLAFSAVTSNKYNCLNNYLLASQNAVNDNLSLNYLGVISGTSCTSGTVVASGINGFGFVGNNHDGTHSLSITVNGNTYNGTITRSGNTFTINWPNTDIVKISPLVVSL